MATAGSLGSVLSFGDTNKAVSEEEEYSENVEDRAGASDDDSGEDDFEFAFAPPLLGAAPAGDIIAHGRILPTAYPVFDRRILLPQHKLEKSPSSSADAAVPEPNTYCAWTPRSVPGSPDRGAVPLPKSASTGQPRRLRLRDVLLGSSGRSHSDGKEKFLFLQPPPTPTPKSAPEDKRGKREQQGKKKKAVVEMDMATAHRRFYSNTAVSGERRPQSTSYLTYRPAFVGFFAAAVGRSSHHPY